MRCAAQPCVTRGIGIDKVIAARSILYNDVVPCYVQSFVKR